MRTFLATILAVLLVVGSTAHDSDAAGDERTQPTWSYSASIYLYLVPHDDDYVQPTVSADRGWLHLEARYNYEDLDTGSLWLGYNLSLGEEATLDVTPKLGFVFGETTGIAPGFHAVLGWKRFVLYSDGEYVVDTDDRENSFFYSWSEATVSPVDRWRAGLVLQRTQVVETLREFQWGILVGVRIAHADIAGHVFDPDHSDPTWVISVSTDI